MRDKRFVAEHRGGPLSIDNHHKLIRWARECSEHVLSLIEGDIDKRLFYALQIAKEWEFGDVTTGDAMEASLGAHAAARQYSDPVSIAVARSVGQTVATAHMADHALGGALYALKAVKVIGKSIEAERDWQYKKLEMLPSEIVDLVKSVMTIKGQSFKL